MLYNLAVQNRIRIWRQSKGQKCSLAMPIGKPWTSHSVFWYRYTCLWLFPLKLVVSQSQGWDWKYSALSGNHGDSSVVLRACTYLSHATEVLNKQHGWKDAEDLKPPSQNQSAKAENCLQVGILPHTADSSGQGVWLPGRSSLKSYFQSFWNILTFSSHFQVAIEW